VLITQSRPYYIRKVSVKPATLGDAGDAVYIAKNIRDQDRREIQAVYRYRYPEDLASYCLEASPHCAWLFAYHDEPVAIYGMTQPMPHIAVGWAFGTDRMWRAVPTMTRHINERGIPSMFARGVHRIEVRSIVDHDISHRWLAKGLGGVFEGICKAYGRNREDFALYARVRD
jgi:hypothetical protein